jgi:hypothetical protein
MHVIDYRRGVLPARLQVSQPFESFVEVCAAALANLVTLFWSRGDGV